MRTPRTAAAAITLLAGLGFPAHAAEKGNPMTLSARGPFDVKVAPLAQESNPGGNALGRYSLDKQYHGELEATAKGEMLTVGTPVDGSAAYVAVERVEGTLGGRRGSFAMQHSATMGHGSHQMTITVVPDSGTGELVGLSGRLEIVIAEGGKHSYVFDYSLPEKR